jgi:predicted alpha/beta-fold hydrolase
MPTKIRKEPFLVSFTPPTFAPWIPANSGHLQTIFGHLLSSDPWIARTETEIIKLTDGDEIELEYLDQKSKLTVILLHGLGGGRRSDYMERSAQVAQNLGWNVVSVDHRGVSTKAKATLTFHSGRGADVGDIIAWSRGRFPKSQIVCVGFSMSGSMVLNLLTGRSGDHQPDYACVVNAPIDLLDASENLQTGFSKIYDIRFYFILKKILLERAHLENLPAIGTVRLLDELHTSRKNGFRDAVDYYQQCSTIDHVHKIQIPTLVLTAADDPFVKVEKYKKAHWSSSVHLHITSGGGHMGYLSQQRHPQFGRRWLDWCLFEYFKSIEKQNI